MSQRIVSLLSSATETACALGLESQIVGISHECDFPKSILDRPRVSRTRVDPSKPSSVINGEVRQMVRQALSIYEVDEQRLAELAPDVILTQDHCRVCAVSVGDVEAACRTLTGTDARVVSTMPTDLEGIRRDFRRIAEAAGVPERGEALVREFDEKLDGVTRAVAGAPEPTVALIEWAEPPMIAGGWMPELARIAGGRPVIVEDTEHFKTVTWDDIATADPDVVMILPCGFDIERTLQELSVPSVAEPLARLRATKEGRCFAVDGNALFNRPGPRIAESAEVLAAALHPDRVAAKGRLAVWQAECPAR